MRQPVYIQTIFPQNLQADLSLPCLNKESVFVWSIHILHKRPKKPCTIYFVHGFLHKVLFDSFFFQEKELLAGLEAVLQADSAVEDQRARLGILGIGAEVTHTQELEAVSSLCFGQRGLYLSLL